MARKKVKLAFITNQSARKATFNKRKGGFIKKINELSVLCGVEACAVIYSPFNSPNPEVWPSNSGVESVMSKVEMLTEMEQEKRMVNHESFLNKSISKTRESNNKKMKNNTEKRMQEVMFQLLGGKEEEEVELNDGNREDLCKYIDEYLKQLYYQRNVILNHQSNVEYGESSSAAAAPTAIAPTTIPEEVRAINSSNHITEHVNSSARDDFRPRDVEQQGYYPMMNPNEDLNINPHQFGYPNVSQDTNEKEQEGWLIDQMMNNSKQMSSLTLDDNNR